MPKNITWLIPLIFTSFSPLLSSNIRERIISEFSPTINTAALLNSPCRISSNEKWKVTRREGEKKKMVRVKKVNEDEVAINGNCNPVYVSLTNVSCYNYLSDLFYKNTKILSLHYFNSLWEYMEKVVETIHGHVSRME